MTNNNSITAAALVFAAENWPITGPVWVRLDQSGNALGWAQRMSECTARAIREEVAKAAREWTAANVGDFVTVPTGFHPRHGVKTSTYCRVR